MAGEEFLKFNNGHKFSFSNFKEIKEEDLKNADAETKRLFNIFAGDDHILQASEAQSLWNKIQTAAAINTNGDDQEFDDTEIAAFIKEFGLNIQENTINSVKNLLGKVFSKSDEKTVMQVL